MLRDVDNWHMYVTGSNFQKRREMVLINHNSPTIILKNITLLLENINFSLGKFDISHSTECVTIFY